MAPPPPAPPTLRVNTYIKGDGKKIYIDTISKLFIVFETIFGLNKSLLLEKNNVFRVFVHFYCISFGAGIIYFALRYSNSKIVTSSMCVLQYIFCFIFTILRCEKLQLYYVELNKFDSEVGCRPLVNRNSLLNLLQLFVTLVLISFLLIYPYDAGWLNVSGLPLLPFRLLYAMEGCFYGHLLGLLNPRLMLINHFIESTLSHSMLTSKTIMGEYGEYDLNRVTNELDPKDMKKIMKIYLIIANAYDYLADAIKYQFMIIIMLSFATILGMLYQLSSVLLRSSDFMVVTVILYLCCAITIMAPIFSSCVFSESVHGKIKHLRELLASKLYENKLDKSGRGTARSLLSVTETRNLSFRLLRVLDIDISLPFKFVALVITYLVILLQFDKILNG